VSAIEEWITHATGKFYASSLQPAQVRVQRIDFQNDEDWHERCSDPGAVAVKEDCNVCTGAAELSMAKLNDRAPATGRARYITQEQMS
jgi:RecJ-like exonuclease